jgi:DNA-binding sugar fermentation-stimulating protein
MFLIYPLLKFTFHVSTCQMLSLCYQNCQISSTYIRYLMMVQITCETIFWSIFYAFQYLTISGFGITRFFVGNEEAKVTTMLIVTAYISCSGYYVTIDSPVINLIIKYFIALFQFYFLFQVAVCSKKNIKIINNNIDYIYQQEEDQSSEESSSV